MTVSLIAPDDDRLAELGLAASVGADPSVRTLSLTAADGTVTVTWDTVARTVHVAWLVDAEPLVEIGRQSVDRVVVGRRGRGHVVIVRSTNGAALGQLTVTVGADVRFRDVVLSS